MTDKKTDSANATRKRGASPHRTSAHTPRLLRQPYLQKGTAHSMGIAWMIDDERPCSVHYGSTRKLDQIVESSVKQRRHFVEITGLEPDQKCYYRIKSGNTWLTPDDPSYYFRAHANDPRRPFSFAVLGDSGDSNSGTQLPAADLLMSLDPKPDFILHTGDLNQRWALDEGEYDLLVFGVYGDILRNTPLYPTQGNHDWVTDWEHNLDPLYPRHFPAGRLASQYVERFDMPFWRLFHTARDNAHGDPGPYSFRFGNAVFVCEAGSGVDAARALAEQRFTEGKDRWRFFYSHYYALAGNAVPGADIPWKPPLPKADIVFRGHIHMYSRSAPYGPDDTIDMLVGTSGQSVGEGWLKDMVTDDNPHGLRPGITDWNEKAAHLIHVRIDGDRLAMRAYYPNGLVFDRFDIDKSGGDKRIDAMPLEDHPVDPHWQEALTPVMKRHWIDENPKWRPVAYGNWYYVGQTPLEWMDAPILRRARYTEPTFRTLGPPADGPPATLAQATEALAHLMSIHYRLGHHTWGDKDHEFFKLRFHHFFGDGGDQEAHLFTLVEDESLPMKHRLGALGGLGLLAENSHTARQQLADLAGSDDLSLVFSSCIIRACWLGNQAGLDDLFAWISRAVDHDPPHPQFDPDAPGHYGNPIFVLRRFTFAHLFSLDAAKIWATKPTIGYWIDFYAKNRHRLKYDASQRRYQISDGHP